jgi:PhnB protein
MECMTTSSEQRPGPAPAGSQRLVTFFAVENCANAIEYYINVFGAEPVSRYEGNDGKVTHAELRLGGCILQLGEPMPSYGIVGPPAEGNAFTITFWTPDVDAVFARAVAAGATVMTPLDDAFSGDRMGVVRCPFGVRWCIARHDRDVSPEEIEAAARGWIASQQS